MLRMSVAQEEYLMIGDDVKIVFLGGTGRHMRIMIDAPREVNIVRSSVIEKHFTDPEIRAKLPNYYAEPEHPEKYKRKPKAVIARGNAGKASGGITPGGNAIGAPKGIAAGGNVGGAPEGSAR